ncbi:hypothetical protein [Actinokineospora iranica]|uniref:Uncharacterized protein n=1 Tax=Actinokineospora iranica TaxID=1271860 RepID=A0A1G6K284_9PSEU|nr:hypothetical protein [Actinokineospora iranica]SDC24998.1 hypothetical protein SAMN05216174_101673 [Actinokineospora iranica]
MTKYDPAERDFTGADCLLCTSADGEPLHLWFRVENHGGVRTWLEESALAPVIFTPAEARQILTGWKTIQRHIRRGTHTDQEICVTPLDEDTGEETAVVFGVQDGHMTYWRTGEPPERIMLGPTVVTQLITAWEKVCDKAERTAAHPDDDPPQASPHPAS